MLDKVILKGPEVQMTDAEFLRFCQDNRDLNIERNAQREIIIMSPTYTSTGLFNGKILFQLAAWNEQHQLGVAFDSSTGFTLPDGSMRSPDASWMTQKKWQRLTEEEKESFAPVCPDFVLLKDRLSDLQEKMDYPGLAVRAPVRQHKDFNVPLSGEVLSGFQLDFSRLKLP